MGKGWEIGASMILAAGVLFGGLAWLTNIDYKASAAAKDIEKIQVLESNHTTQFEEIRTRLQRIEDKITQ